MAWWARATAVASSSNCECEPARLISACSRRVDQSKHLNRSRLFSSTISRISTRCVMACVSDQSSLATGPGPRTGTVALRAKATARNISVVDLYPNSVYIWATYQVQTNLSVQTVQTNCGGEVEGGFCKSVIRSGRNYTCANPPTTSPPQLVCTVYTERLVCTRYVPLIELYIYKCS